MITTRRTLLRRFKETDIQSLIRLESDPEVMKYTGIGMAISETETRERLSRLISQNPKDPLGVWAAESLDDQKFIGWFMLKIITGTEPELGFMLTPENWNQGYATEIATRLIEYGFSLGFESIIASANVENLPSIRVLEKSGMKFTRDYWVFNARLNRDIPLKEFQIERIQ